MMRCAFAHTAILKFRSFISVGTFARLKSQMRNSQKEIKGRNCFLGLNVGVLDTFANLILARYGKMACFLEVRLPTSCLQYICTMPFVVGLQAPCSASTSGL